jgi:hypothetical protein
MRKMFLALVSLAASLTAGAALAEDKSAGLTPAQQAEARLALETARNLISYGEAKNDALALVTGAKLLSSVPGRVLADNESGKAGKNFDVEAVLKKAENLAKGNELILQVAKQVRGRATANSKATCHWEYYCYYNGRCEYTYDCD